MPSTNCHHVSHHVLTKLDGRRNTYDSCAQNHHEEVENRQGSLAFGGEPLTFMLIQP
jgi:hypothetical protein